jgi:hypothetical protein
MPLKWQIRQDHLGQHQGRDPRGQAAEASRRHCSQQGWQVQEGEKEMKKPVFKPCNGCPTPAKCKAAGRCLMKGKK